MARVSVKRHCVKRQCVKAPMRQCVSALTLVLCLAILTQKSFSLLRLDCCQVMKEIIGAILQLALWVVVPCQAIGCSVAPLL